jgi:hypothetical protein
VSAPEHSQLFSAIRIGEDAADSEAVAAARPREYYDPYTGGGMAASGFGRSSLILEMLDPDPPRPRQLPGGELVGAARIPGRSGVRSLPPP